MCLWNSAVSKLGERRHFGQYCEKTPTTAFPNLSHIIPAWGSPSIPALLQGIICPHWSCEQGIILPQTLQVPPEPQRKPTQFDKSRASALGHVFVWPLIQLQIPLHFLQPDADCTRSHFKKYNGKHCAGTGWSNTIMQVLNMDGSAPYPLLSFFPWAPLSCQPQRFGFAGSMFPQCSCLLNSERPAYGVCTASFPMIPHMLESITKSGNNC